MEPRERELSGRVVHSGGDSASTGPSMIPGMRRIVKVADVDLEICVEDDELSGAVDVVFSGCAPGDDPQLVLRRRREAIEPPAVPPTTTTDQASYWFLESGVVARHSSGVCGRRRGDMVEVGGVCDGADPNTAFRLSMQMPLTDALAQHDCQVVHAAAIERDGVAVLVTGTSGAGKSTFAYASQAGGWTVLNDDLTIVRGGDTVAAWGFPKPLHVPADVLVQPPAGSAALPDDERGRWSLRPPLVERTSPAELRFVVAVDRSDAEALTDDGGAGVPWVKELLYSFPLVRIPERLKSVFPTAAALSRLPSFRYFHDADPARRVEGAVGFLDALITAAPRDRDRRSDGCDHQ